MRWALAAWIVLAPATARADDWYGWQTMSADAASIGLGASLLMLTDSPAPGLYIGLAGYAVAPPIIHATHDEPARAVGSGVLRVGLPIASAAALALTAPDDGTSLGRGILGFAAGILVASLVDGIALARH